MKILHKIIALAFLIISLAAFTCLVLASHSLWIDPSSFSILSLLSLTFPVCFLLVTILAVLALILKYWPSLVICVLGLWWSFAQLMNYTPLGGNGSGSEGSGARQLSILSYNVGGFYRADDAWDTITNYIMESGADVVLIQEYRDDGPISVFRQTYPFHHVGATGYKGRGSHLAILSKYPIISQEDMNLDGNINGGWSYLLKMGSDTIWVANCHLESNRMGKEDMESYGKVISSAKVDTIKQYVPNLIRKIAHAAKLRAPQARRVDSLAQEHLHKGHGVIVAGDFNDTPQSYAHEILARSLQDAFKASGHGPGYTYKNGSLRFRIDHILTSKDMEPLDCKVDASIKASDHFPIQSMLKKVD